MTVDLSRPWTDYPLVVCDFETDGPDPDTCMPVEIAVVRYEGARVAAKFQTLLNPGRWIHAEAVAVHGITNEMVADAPDLVSVSGEIAKIAAGAIPCAFNAPFDRTVLHHFVTGSDVPLFDPFQSWLDVFVIVAKLDKYVAGSGRLKLGNACARRGVSVEGAHRALADCLATHALLTQMQLSGEIKPVAMAKLLEHTDKMRAEQQKDYWRYRVTKWAETASADELREMLNLLNKKEVA